MAGSTSEATNRVGAVISRRRDFGVGIRTWNSSISTCHPHCFSRPAIHSALSLSYGDPRWCGRADMRLMYSPIFAASGMARNCASQLWGAGA